MELNLIEESKTATLECAPDDSGFASSTNSLWRWLRVAIRQRRLVSIVAAAVVVLGLAITLLLPNRYTATVVLLPPQQGGSAGAAITAQLSMMSGAMSGASGLSIKNPNDQQVALLKSRIVEESIVERFHLQALYGKRHMSSARTRWERETKADNGLKDGLIRLDVTDSDPRRAAEMANAWVEEYRRFSSTLAITEASQRRLFYKQQLDFSKQDLVSAENAMKETQQRTGVIDVEGQDRTLLASAAVLRAQLAAKQIEIKAMRQFAAERNPDLERAEQELSGMEGQLGAMDADADRKAGDIVVPKGNVSEGALEYTRALREVKYREAIVDLLTRQYEGARVDEAREGSLIQVVEPAVPPDRSSLYKRWVAIAILLCAFPIGLLAAVLAEIFSILQAARLQSGSWVGALETVGVR